MRRVLAEAFLLSFSKTYSKLAAIMPLRRRTTRDVRLTNRANVLYTLHREGPISRQDVAAAAGVSAATSANVVGQLLEEGVLTEAGQLPSSGGRPASLVGINPAFAGVIGVDVGETGVRLELFDLTIERRLMVERSARAGKLEVARIVEFVADGVDELLETSGLDRADVLGLGVGVPGIVEDDGTSLVHAPSIGWNGVAFAGLLQESIGIGVTLDNGAKALGTAEAWFGAATEARNVVVCLIGTGVGASILTDGRVYRGASASAGEWGHTTVVLDGDACRCGSRGCLEAYVGAPAIAERWRRASRARGVVDLSDEQAIERLAAEAQAGRAAAVRVLRDTARYLGAGLSDLINLLNPDRIVIGGWVGLRLGPLLLALLREEARARSLTPPFERASLDLCHLGPDAVALGAATIVVDRFFAAGGRREALSTGAGRAHRVARNRS